MEAWARERRTNKEVDLRHEMLTLLRRLELDMDRLSCLHVAGTKGKGSTCAFAESILRRGYGLRTGLFTSPHLVDVRERIRLDGKPLERDVFARYFWDTWDRLHATTQGNETPEMPAYFRFLTLMSFNVFIREEVDVALVEVGVGGRTDATNVVHPDACGISSLGYDHQKVLGDTLTEIAYEKAGIFKTGVPAYTVPQTDEAMLSLVKQAAIKKVDLSVVPPIEVWGKHCTLGLLGEFQKNNASLAVALCRQWLRNNTERLPPHIDRQELAPFLRSFGPSSPELPAGFAKGLRECRWPGRAQLLRLPTGLGDAEEKSHNRGEDELWLHLDGAHTEESMEACARWFIDSSSQDQDGAYSSSDAQERRVLIFNCQQNRSASKLLTRLADTMSGGAGPGRRVSFDAVIFSTFATRPGPGSDRPVVSEAADKDSRSWQQAQADAWTSLNRTDQGPTAEATVADSIPAALDSVVGLHKRWWHHDRCTSGGPRGRTRVLVTGSLYLVGGVLEVLLSRNAVPASALHL